MTASAIGRLDALGVDRSARTLLAGMLVLLVVALVGARIAPIAFYVGAAGLLLAFAAFAWSMPRAAIVALVLAPIVDRYLVSLLLPRSLETITNVFSELLLLVVGLTVAIRAARDAALWPALRHPAVAILVAFVAVAGLSAMLNAVPPVVALAGIAFTIDATALFVLPRLARFEARHLEAAATVYIGLALVAALLALGQVILHPDLFGLRTIGGAFSEGLRVAAFLGNPNMLATVLAMAIPFVAVRTARAGFTRRGLLGAAITFVLVLAMLYAFSRGTWLALGLGMLLIGVLERRALLIVLLVGGLAFGAAHVLPRELMLPESERHRFSFWEATVGRVDAIGEGRDLRFLFIANAAPIVEDHPLIGAGPGRYGGAVAWRFGSPLYDEYTAGRVPRDRTVDNFWLHALVEFGALGVALLMTAIGGPVRDLLLAGRRAAERTRGLLAPCAAAGVILGTVSLTEMVLEGNTTAFAMWFWLGAGSALLLGAGEIVTDADASATEVTSG